MSISARSILTTAPRSFDTAREVASELRRSFEAPPKLVVAYLTVNHDQAAFLGGIRSVLGPEVPVVGCSAQGVIGPGRVCEDGYAAGLLALGGDDLDAACATVDDIAVDTLEKGKALGAALRAPLGGEPRVTVLLYDPLCGADVDVLLEGVYGAVRCPIVGGGASHAFTYERLEKTAQYFGEQVKSRSAVAFALSGSFGVDVGSCHGCSPVGVELTVTRAEGNVLLELDGRSALDVWTEICGPDASSSGNSAALAIGLPVEEPGLDGEYLIRAGYALNPETGGVVLGSSIAVGTRIMLHHRSVDDLFHGARRMASSLRERLHGRVARAVLGFECGARTGPFLGAAETARENAELQAALGGDAAWLGTMPWGEILPVRGRPTLHNYSYPLLVLSD